MNRLESLVHKLTCLRVSQSAILASPMLHNNENLRAPQSKFNNPPGKKIGTAGITVILSTRLKEHASATPPEHPEALTNVYECYAGMDPQAGSGDGFAYVVRILQKTISREFITGLEIHKPD